MAHELVALVWTYFAKEATQPEAGTPSPPMPVAAPAAPSHPVTQTARCLLALEPWARLSELLRVWVFWIPRPRQAYLAMSVSAPLFLDLLGASLSLAAARAVTHTKAPVAAGTPSRETPAPSREVRLAGAGAMAALAPPQMAVQVGMALAAALAAAEGETEALGICGLSLSRRLRDAY